MKVEAVGLLLTPWKTYTVIAKKNLKYGLGTGLV
jgi:hypothetical protein